MRRTAAISACWLRDGDSIVLALHAGPIDFETLPFVTVARLLRAVPLPVPAAAASLQRARHHRAAGSGRRHAAGAPRRRDAPTSTPRSTARRCRSSRCCSSAAPSSQSDDYPPYRVAFDTDKLSWELEFFYKYFLKQYRGVSPSVEVQRALSQEWSAIVEELAGEPRVLCHRDYHSRNLMLHDGSLFIIDFQDARMGPDTYDLVSLLRDSYVDLTSRQVDELIAYFLALKHGPSGVPPADARNSAAAST